MLSPEKYMEPPAIPLPQAIWRTNQRPYFHSEHSPLNKSSRDLPWGLRTIVADSKDSNVVIHEEGLELGEIIGYGTFSSVYCAYWTTYQQSVAVKVYEKPRQNTPAQALPALKKVTTEIDVLQRIQHPNIVGFFGAMETKIRVYLIFELVQRGNLLAYIKSAGPVGESYLSKKWFAQLAGAMTFIHRKEIAHRDIKCENILLDSDLNIRVSDFGFAVQNITWLETVSNDVFVKIDEFCGSLAYMSPEVVQHLPYCPVLSDVWSMGVVLYAMVFGKFPFEEVNEQNIVTLSGKFRVPADVKISRQLEDIFRNIFLREEKRIRSYQLLEKAWIAKETNTIFLAQIGHLSIKEANILVNNAGTQIPDSIMEEIS